MRILAAFTANLSPEQFRSAFLEELGLDDDAFLAWANDSAEPFSELVIIAHSAISSHEANAHGNARAMMSANLGLKALLDRPYNWHRFQRFAERLVRLIEEADRPGKPPNASYRKVLAIFRQLVQLDNNTPKS